MAKDTKRKLKVNPKGETKEAAKARVKKRDERTGPYTRARGNKEWARDEISDKDKANSRLSGGLDKDEGYGRGDAQDKLAGKARKKRVAAKKRMDSKKKIKGALSTKGK
jgi:hypothetical protein